MTDTTNEKNQTSKSIMETCFLQKTPCLYSHVQALLTNKDTYLSTLQTLCEKGLMDSTTISQAVKARVIAALHITNHHSHLKMLLPHCDVVEITKAVTMLDRPRRARQLETKIHKIEENHPHLVVDTTTTTTTDGIEENDGEIRRRQSRRGRRRAKHSLVEVELEQEQEEPTRKRKRQAGIKRLRRQLREVVAVGDRDHTESTCDAVKTAHTNSAVVELIESSSVSGALSLKIREWARSTLKKDFLEFVLLTMPLDTWKKLSDLVHFHPDDFSLSCFLSVVHGGPLPEGSFVKDTRDMLDAFKQSKKCGVSAFKRLAKAHPQIYLNYSFLRTQTDLSDPEVGAMLARKIPLGTAIWFLEELNMGSKNNKIPKIVYERLQKEGDWMSFDSKVTNSFGKMVERILTFQSRKWDRLADALIPAAEYRLSALKEEYSCDQEPRTAVFGDASSSMQAAIEAATILATMVSVYCGGELSFFHSCFQESPHPRPTTVEQILEICRKIKATGCTSIAAALGPYYTSKRVLDRIVLVTDEGENTGWNHHWFASLLATYKKEVSPNLELIIVGVGPGERSFKQSLDSHGIKYKRIEIDGRRPDLSKFDALLGQIAMSSDTSVDAVMDADGKAGGDEFVMV